MSAEYIKLSPVKELHKNIFSVCGKLYKKSIVYEENNGKQNMNPKKQHLRQHKTIKTKDKVMR